MTQFNDPSFGDVTLATLLRDMYALIRDDNEAADADKMKRLPVDVLLGATLGYASQATSRTMTGNVTLTDADGAYQYADPNGADRVITLPAEGDGNHPYIAGHIGSANTVTWQDDASNTIVTLAAGDVRLIVPRSGAWEVVSGGGGGLTYVAKTITTANLTLVEGESHLADVSGMTADRDIILPTPSAAGVECEIILTTDAPASYEAVVKINGVELTRLFINGEKLKFISTGTGAADWIVADDGRKPQYATIILSSNQTGVATNVATKIMFDTAKSEQGNIFDSANSQIVMRRDCTILVGLSVGSDNINATRIFADIRVAGVQSRKEGRSSGGKYDSATTPIICDVSIGNTLSAYYWHNQGSDVVVIGLNDNARTYVTVKEII